MAKPVIVWDSCIFIGWFGGEYAPGSSYSINDHVLEIEASKIILVTSAIVHAEVLDGDLPNQTHDTFSQFLKRTNVEQVDVSETIIKEVRRIRTECTKLNPVLPIPKAIDALYLATAILAKAKILYTKEQKLRNLDRHDVAHGLRIELAPKSSELC